MRHLQRAVVGLCLLALTACGNAPSGDEDLEPASSRAQRPNIVVIVLDDFSSDLVQTMRSARAMKRAGASYPHSFVTDSTAGAGGGKVAIAGSLALEIADVKTNAQIHSNAGRGPPGHNLNSNDLTLSAASIVVSTTKAKAKSEDSETVGVGAGAAISSIDDITTATISAGAAITGAKDVTLTASGTNTITTYAEAGTAGGSGSTLALTADAAITLADVETRATIGGSASQTLTTSGKVTLSATQTAKTTTTAKADAVSGTVVIGLALALAIVEHEVTATVTRSAAAGKVRAHHLHPVATGQRPQARHAAGVQRVGQAEFGKAVVGPEIDLVTGRRLQAPGAEHAVQRRGAAEWRVGVDAEHRA